jgi:hypothetical protein
MAFSKPWQIRVNFTEVQTMKLPLKRKKFLTTVLLIFIILVISNLKISPKEIKTSTTKPSWNYNYKEQTCLNKNMDQNENIYFTKLNKKAWNLSSYIIKEKTLEWKTYLSNTDIIKTNFEGRGVVFICRDQGVRLLMASIRSGITENSKIQPFEF